MINLEKIDLDEICGISKENDDQNMRKKIIPKSYYLCYSDLMDQIYTASDSSLMNILRYWTIVTDITSLNISLDSIRDRIWKDDWQIFKNKMLLLSIEIDDVNLVKYWLDLGADVNYKCGKCIVHVAECSKSRYIEYNSCEIYDLLLSVGANINAYNGYALLISIYNYNYDLCIYLLNKGIEMNVDKYPDLFITITKYYNDCKSYYTFFNILLKNGFDIHTKNDYVFLSFCIFGSRKFIDIFKPIIDKFDVNMFDGLPIKLAIINANFRIIKFLLNNGADISKINYIYLRRLMNFSYYDSESVIEILSIISDNGFDLRILDDLDANEKFESNNQDLLCKQRLKIYDFLCEKGVSEKMINRILNF